MRQMNTATRCMDPFNLNKASQQLASLCQRAETHIPERESYQAALNRCCQHLNNKTLNFTSSITCHVKPSQLNSFRFSFCPNNKECLITKCNVLISIRSQLSIKPTPPFRLPRTVATLSIKKCTSFNFHGLPVNFSHRVFTSNGSLVINLATCEPQVKNGTCVLITYVRISDRSLLQITYLSSQRFVWR